MVATDAEILVRLLRVALGRAASAALPPDADFEAVYRLAQRQGVVAIAYDGIKALGDCGIDGDLRYMWLGQSMVVEEQAKARWQCACRLAGLFANEGIKTTLLKGFAYAAYYPQPFHRISSDLDIYLGGDFENGNKIVEKSGVAVDRNDSRHSHFVVGNIPVENHQFCMGVRGNRRNKQRERFLRRLLEEQGPQIAGSCVYSPIWMFNALFFMLHARQHLLVGGGITMKYVCDWMLLKRCGEATGQQELFWQRCADLEVEKFARAMDSVADYVSDGRPMDRGGTLLWREILAERDKKGSGNGRWRAHWRMIRSMWGGRWRYAAFSDTTATKEIATYVYGYLFDRHPKV